MVGTTSAAPISARAASCLVLPDWHNCFCQNFLGTKMQRPLQPQLKEWPPLNKINRSNPKSEITYRNPNVIVHRLCLLNWELACCRVVCTGQVCRMDGDILLQSKWVFSLRRKPCHNACPYGQRLGPGLLSVLFVLSSLSLPGQGNLPLEGQMQSPLLCPGCGPVLFFPLPH